MLYTPIFSLPLLESGNIKNGSVFWETQQSLELFVTAPISYAVVGDSIAANVGPYMGECLIDATGGIPSVDIIDRVHPADVLFISAASNASTIGSTRDRRWNT